ncbi:hypothetical protein [Yinghuangia soli]|uniref:Uncharacterized protein n=1 Tax=Yinghuangia soli TaxID=2908204 RepID=A0AA41Q6S8_9ACTN|nr:hypothetical protein [Yinghuangia soli]MCF2532639.1 hypothetical protein [Yinghuangia soli]
MRAVGAAVASAVVLAGAAGLPGPGGPAGFAGTAGAAPAPKRPLHVPQLPYVPQAQQVPHMPQVPGLPLPEGCPTSFAKLDRPLLVCFTAAARSVGPGTGPVVFTVPRAMQLEDAAGLDLAAARDAFGGGRFVVTLTNADPGPGGALLLALVPDPAARIVAREASVPAMAAATADLLRALPGGCLGLCDLLTAGRTSGAKILEDKHAEPNGPLVALPVPSPAATGGARTSAPPQTSPPPPSEPAGQPQTPASTPAADGQATQGQDTGAARTKETTPTWFLALFALVLAALLLVGFLYRRTLVHGGGPYPGGGSPRGGGGGSRGSGPGAAAGAHGVSTAETYAGSAAGRPGVPPPVAEAPAVPPVPPSAPRTAYRARKVPGGTRRTATIRTRLHPQGYVELDHCLVRATWAEAEEPPGVGESVDTVTDDRGAVWAVRPSSSGAGSRRDQRDQREQRDQRDQRDQGGPHGR